MCSCNSTESCVAVELKLSFYWTNGNISTLSMCHVQLQLNRNMCCNGVEVELRLSHGENINSADKSCATVTQPKYVLQWRWSRVSIEPMRTYQPCWCVMCNWNSTETCVAVELKLSLYWATAKISTLLISHVQLQPQNMCCSVVEVELRLRHCEHINCVDESCGTATQPKHMLQSNWSRVSIEPMRTY
jgi:hypothetical protein